MQMNDLLDGGVDSMVYPLLLFLSDGLLLDRCSLALSFVAGKIEQEEKALKRQCIAV